MGNKRLKLAAGEIETTRRRLDRWRKGKAKQARIPEALWTEAVGLAQVHGVHRISKALRINYERLKLRVEAKDQQKRERGGERATFVEVAMDKAGGESEAMSVELINRHGDRMRVLAGGERGLEVTGLMRAFLGSSS